MTPLLATFTPRTLAWQDYLFIALYFAINLGIGWWCARRKKTSSGEFFLGGNRVGWIAMSISFFATSTSSISFMALPARTYGSNWLSFGSAPAQAFAGVLTGIVFVNLLRRLNLTTVFGYLEKRFDRRVRLLGAGLGVLLKVGGRMSVVMLLPALALSTVTGLNVFVSIGLMGVVTTIYAMEGGFEAVIWTDVMQVGVTMGGVAIAFYFLASGVNGGLGGIVHAGEAAGKFHMVSWAPNVSEPTAWVFIGMFFGHIFTQLGDQPQMQRMLAATDAAAARRTVVTGNLIGCVGSFIFFSVGTSLWAFYHAHPDRLADGVPQDAIFPYFIANELPHGVVGLIIAGLFAAAMGALSSALNATAAIIVTDFQAELKPGATPAQQVRLARRATLICGVIATGMAFWLASRDVKSLWDAYLNLTALIGGGFPGVFALGLLTRRANAWGAMIGAVASIGVTLAVQTLTTTNAFLQVFVAVSSCFVIGYVASRLLSGAAGKKDLRGLTLWDAV